MKHKILIVDDEVEIVNLLRKFFIKKGFEVVTALGGDEAIGIFGSGNKIDLVILDFKMPGMKGIDILKEMSGLGIKTPVIFLTGSIGLTKYLKDLRSVGFDRRDLLTKPIDLDVLLEKVKGKLSQKPE
ncbi:MAG: response regulator [Candidatus Omnitrophota bacterium]|nr:response regulator [Candidatus Omnitrophota bacterium]